MKRAEYFFAYFNKKNINKLLAGLLAGLCCGLFGSGGGAVAVVALERMCGFASKDAHATAISIMLPLTFASAAGIAQAAGWIGIPCFSRRRGPYWAALPGRS